MILDAGVLTIYRVSSTEGTAPPPVRYSLDVKRTAPYGEKVVGATRYYAAAKVGQRLDRTVRIWRDASIPIREVCFLCGYDDPRYFAKLFKKHAGMTPSEFRNLYAAGGPPPAGEEQP